MRLTAVRKAVATPSPTAVKDLLPTRVRDAVGVPKETSVLVTERRAVDAESATAETSRVKLRVDVPEP